MDLHCSPGEKVFDSAHVASPCSDMRQLRNYLAKNTRLPVIIVHVWHGFPGSRMHPAAKIEHAINNGSPAEDASTQGSKEPGAWLAAGSRAHSPCNDAINVGSTNAWR